jgi:hypothetical protein
MSVLLEYESQVPVDGYDVITTRHRWFGKQKVRMLHPRSKRTRRFNVFESSSSLFLEFERTPLTEEGVKDFADRYGPLAPELWGLHIADWFEHIQSMHRAVELWRKSTVTGDFSRIIREVQKFPFGDIDMGALIALSLKKDPSSALPKLCIRPMDLLQALWAQLVLAIDGNVNLRPCAQCRKWFTLEAGKGRSDKEYCSNACRMRAYRRRKDSG